MCPEHVISVEKRHQHGSLILWHVLFFKLIKYQFVNTLNYLPNKTELSPTKKGFYLELLRNHVGNTMQLHPCR